MGARRDSRAAVQARGGEEFEGLEAEAGPAGYEDQEEAKGPLQPWDGSTRDYTYRELLGGGRAPCTVQHAEQAQAEAALKHASDALQQAKRRLQLLSRCIS